MKKPWNEESYAKGNLAGRNEERERILALLESGSPCDYTDYYDVGDHAMPCWDVDKLRALLAAK